MVKSSVVASKSGDVDTSGGPSAPTSVTKEHCIRLTTHTAVRFYRKPRAEQTETRREFNFLTDTLLQQSTVVRDAAGVHLTLPRHYDLFIPWANVEAYWFEKK